MAAKGGQHCKPRQPGPADRKATAESKRCLPVLHHRVEQICVLVASVRHILICLYLARLSSAAPASSWQLVDGKLTVYLMEIHLNQAL